MNRIKTLKWHYLLWFGSLAGVLQFAPLIARKYAAASATEVIIYLQHSGQSNLFLI